MAGVAAALGGGLLLGMVARPDLDDGAPKAARMEPAAPRTMLPVEMAPAPQAAAARTSPPLEILPQRPSQQVATRVPEPAPQRRSEPAPSPRAEPRESPPPRAEPSPARASTATAEPSFNCRFARSRAENMVCGDPGLARLDRRLDDAFRRAVASGVPYRQLRAEQDDWLGIREFAAGRSPEDVASIYRQRISELNEIAE